MFRLSLAHVALLLSLSASSYGSEAARGVSAAPPTSGPKVESEQGYLTPYSETIPGTEITFEMLPVPGGVAKLNVAADGSDPVYCDVQLPPFWVGRCEVTWSEFHCYMKLDKAYTQLAQFRSMPQRDGAPEALQGRFPNLISILRPITKAEGSLLAVDAVTAPTPLYDPSSTYESGEDPELPAVTMSPFGARQYTKWLSAITGVDYRLPSEAEWRHATLAGRSAEGPIDRDELDAIAWHTENSDWIAHKVGEKEPNAWGLHDTLGNVAELVLDAHSPEGRAELAGKQLSWDEAINWPTKNSMRIAMGGWWDAEPEEINANERLVTEEDEWKLSDPNLPRSPWWYADYPATGVGFRIVRSLRPVPDDLKARVWDTSDQSVTDAVDERLREGRGKMGLIGPDLPKALGELADPEVKKLLN